MNNVQDTPRRDSSGDNPLGFLKNLKPKHYLWISLSAAGAAVLLLIAANLSIAGAGEQLQNTANAQYRNAQRDLGNCLDQSRQAARVAKQFSEEQRKTLEAAVTGRYVDKNGNSTAAKDATERNRAYFSAVNEAYPDLSKTAEIFRDVLIRVTGCRDTYNNSQKLLEVAVTSLEDWKDNRNLFNFWGKSRFPTDGLEAVVPGTATVKGEAALDRMKEVVVVKEAGEAYRSGELSDENPFEDK